MSSVFSKPLVSSSPYSHVRADSPATNGIPRKHVDDLFRAGMVKLNMSTSYLKPIPAGKRNPLSRFVRVADTHSLELIFHSHCTDVRDPSRGGGRRADANVQGSSSRSPYFSSSPSRDSSAHLASGSPRRTSRSSGFRRSDATPSKMTGPGLAEAT